MTRSESSQPFPGPLVNGQTTFVTILSSQELPHSPLVPSMIETINAAYRKSETAHAHLGMTAGDRVGSAEEFTLNTAHDSEAFIVAIHSKDRDQVFGTATARRYLGPPQNPPAKNSPWVRRSDVEDGFEEWELKMMATRPDAERQGLAGFMMRLVDDEIIRRFRVKQLTIKKDASTAPKKLKMTLCTPTEVTGAFYLRRGYKIDYEVERGEGYKFHIVFMSKEIEFRSSKADEGI